MHPTRGEMTYELTREKLKPAVRRFYGTIPYASLVVGAVDLGRGENKLDKE